MQATGNGLSQLGLESRFYAESLPLINPNAAGIDVGAKEHLVAVPPDRDPQPVRTFQAFTRQTSTSWQPG
jgi:hypothetical protein